MKLEVFDFDGTLFRSPDKPEGWSGGWWGRLESLSPPQVPEQPDESWWNKRVVAAAKAAAADRNTVSVLLTGRIQKFRPRLVSLTGQAGLVFDEMHLSSGGSTEAFKLSVLDSLLKKYDVSEVSLWEDRPEHLDAFVAHLRNAGLSVHPHLVRG